MANMKQPAPARPSGSVVPRTSAQILDVAERLAQTRGFNGFSYADIAAELGITKASLHYHFPSKAELGQALIDRYSRTFADALEAIEQGGAPAPAQLERYVAIYAEVLKRGRICLCGMLAAEYTTLPVSMQGAIRAFFDLNERWLSRVLGAGRAQGTLAFDGPARDAARIITSALEGAMLLARPFGGGTRFAVAAERLLREFAPVPPVVAGARRSRPRTQPRIRRPVPVRARR
jgi:TetR/AcrR family transcriptional regulator, transcriptional repressor for nem operon